MRQDGQQNKNDLRYKDFKAELLEKEKRYFKEKNEKQGIFESIEDDVKESVTFKEPDNRKKVKTDSNLSIKQQLEQYGSDDEDVKNQSSANLLTQNKAAINSDEASSSDNDSVKKKLADSINPFP